MQALGREHGEVGQADSARFLCVDNKVRDFSTASVLHSELRFVCSHCLSP